MLFNEFFLSSHKQGKTKGRKKASCTSGLNYLYLIWENGASVFIVAAPGSNNSSKVTSYMRGPGVVPQRDKMHIQNFIHDNLMLLGRLDDCKAQLCCALSGRRPVTERRGTKQENPKRHSFIPSDPHLPRRSLPFCPLFKFSQSF